ncbi:hypothetical protein CONLIGDRAFT_504782 [Coniochaeta ligniaria NRRL 30616]|uniref:BTB domain-containing protein n=1 Tax=Coniochaeta ligniaria NRRL 30616 TaxID=1408157 RepID=A0A1J7IEW8_9PEZI|nr:hypothetical protein CONLIGDRAFT_504782 [Coniochaeta ligniaria NRRL 30616]
MSHASGSNQAEEGSTRKRSRTVGDQGRRSITLPAEDTMEFTDISLGEIHVGTGEEVKVWKVHIKRFAGMSAWLKRAFITAVSEQAGVDLPTVKLPGDDPRIFQWVHNYIYAVSFAGLKGADVPVINNAGTSGSHDDDIVIMSSRVKVEDHDNPLASGSAANQNAAAAQTPDANDDLKEVAADAITPRDLMVLYLLAYKLEIFSLRNKAIDALHTWYHPDAQEKRKPSTVAGAVGAPANNDDYEPAKLLPFGRVPWMTDVQYVFAHTPDGNSLRRLLIWTCVMCLFSKRPQKKKLPEDWNDVLTSTGEIGCAMIKTIASLGWVKGTKDCKDIVIWQKFTFHEAETSIDLDV